MDAKPSLLLRASLHDLAYFDAEGRTGDMAGASVCLYPAGNPCTTTDDKGAFALGGLPTDEPFAIMITATGYPGYVQQWNPLDPQVRTERFGIFEESRTAVGKVTAPTGKKLDPAKGHVLFQVAGGWWPNAEGIPVAGARFALVAAAGDGPYYFFPSIPLTLDPALHETQAAFAAGLVLNVPPGEWEYRVTAPGLRCGAYSGYAWPGASPDTFRVVVAADSVTQLITVCN